MKAENTGGDAQTIDYDPEGLSEEEIAVLEGSQETEEAETAPETTSDTAEAETSAQGESGEAAKEEEKPNPAADPQRPDGYVPLQALQETRAQLRQMQDWQRQIAEKLVQQQQAQAKPEGEQPEIPNREEDPFGYMGHQDQRIAALEKQIQERSQREQTEQQWAQFDQDVDREFNLAAMEKPEVAKAMEFVNMALATEYQNIHARTGVPWEKFQREAIRQHSAYARRNNIPIGDYITLVASTRGWQADGGQQAQKQEVDTKQAGVDPERVKQAQAQVEKLAQAQEANKTLGKGASGDSGEPSLKTLAAMSGEELERFAARNPELFEQLSGIAD